MIKLKHNFLQSRMNKKKNLAFFLTLILLTNCSFDNKTGIWDDKKKEEVRISEIEKKQ